VLKQGNMQKMSRPIQSPLSFLIAVTVFPSNSTDKSCVSGEVA